MKKDCIYLPKQGPHVSKPQNRILLSCECNENLVRQFTMASRSIWIWVSTPFSNLDQLGVRSRTFQIWTCFWSHKRASCRHSTAVHIIFLIPRTTPQRGTLTSFPNEEVEAHGVRQGLTAPKWLTLHLNTAWIPDLHTAPCHDQWVTVG